MTPASAQVQQIIYDMQHLIPEEEACGSNPGMHQQKLLIDSYLHNEALIQQTDQRYGRGASRFMGKALRIYFDKEDAAKKTEMKKQAMRKVKECMKATGTNKSPVALCII